MSFLLLQRVFVNLCLRVLLYHFEEFGTNEISPHGGQIFRPFVEIRKPGTRHWQVFGPENLFDVSARLCSLAVQFRVTGPGTANPSERMFIDQQVENDFDPQDRAVFIEP
ncbi:MAG: hypothetical protein VCA36_05110 [Opitutales bacterium]